MVKQRVHTLTKEDIDNMIYIKWGKHVERPINPAYVPNHVIGRLYGIDGSSVRRLYMK